MASKVEVTSDIILIHQREEAWCTTCKSYQYSVRERVGSDSYPCVVHMGSMGVRHFGLLPGTSGNRARGTSGNCALDTIMSRSQWSERPTYYHVHENEDAEASHFVGYL